MPNTTPWILHIAKVSGNHMDMDMWNRLPGSFTGIETDVVSIWFRFQLLIQDLLGLVDQVHQGCLLFTGAFKPGWYHSPGNDQSMAFGYRVIVKNGKR